MCVSSRNHFKKKKKTAHWGQQKTTNHDRWTYGDLMHDQVMMRWQVNIHQLTCDNWMPQNQSNFGPKLLWFCEVALIYICCRPWTCAQMACDLLNLCKLSVFPSPALVICKGTVESEEWIVKLKPRKTVCRRRYVSPGLPCNKWATEHFLAVALHHNNLSKYLFKTYLFQVVMVSLWPREKVPLKLTDNILRIYLVLIDLHQKAILPKLGTFRMGDQTFPKKHVIFQEINATIIQFTVLFSQYLEFLFPRTLCNVEHYDLKKL